MKARSCCCAVVVSLLLAAPGLVRAQAPEVRSAPGLSLESQADGSRADGSRADRSQADASEADDPQVRPGVLLPPMTIERGVGEKMPAILRQVIGAQVGARRMTLVAGADISSVIGRDALKALERCVQPRCFVFPAERLEADHVLKIKISRVGVRFKIDLTHYTIDPPVKGGSFTAETFGGRPALSAAIGALLNKTLGPIPIRKRVDLAPVEEAHPGFGPWPWMAAGLAAATAGAGAWMSLSKSSRDSDIESKLRRGELRGPALQSEVDDSNRDGLVATILYSFAGASALTAIYFFVFPAGPGATEEPTDPWEPSVGLGPGGRPGASLKLQF